MKDIAIWILLILLILFHKDLLLYGKLLTLAPKLKRLCKKKGYSLVWHRSPMSHSRKSGGTLLCRIDAGSRSYEVALMSSKYRLREYFFISPTELGIYRTIGGIWVKTRARLLKGISPAHFVSFGTSYQTVPVKFEQDLPKDTERILLFYPVAKELTWNAPGKGKQYLGNGDLMFCDYRVFSLSAFLSELESPGKYLRKVDPWKEY